MKYYLCRVSLRSFIYNIQRHLSFEICFPYCFLCYGIYLWNTWHNRCVRYIQIGSRENSHVCKQNVCKLCLVFSIAFDQVWNSYNLKTHQTAFRICVRYTHIRLLYFFRFCFCLQFLFDWILKIFNWLNIRVILSSPSQKCLRKLEKKKKQQLQK